jgi:hypothetical protein
VQIRGETAAGPPDYVALGAGQAKSQDGLDNDIENILGLFSQSRIEPRGGDVISQQYARAADISIKVFSETHIDVTEFLDGYINCGTFGLPINGKTTPL